jgi:hypothetical protein
MNFSRDTFTSNLGGYTGISFSGGDASWDQWTGTTGNLNTQLSYDKGNFSYRTWSPETSNMPTDLGMVVSCKLDFANGIGDDHIILLVGFLKVQNSAPTINFVQASVQFYNDTDQNIMTDPLKSDPNNPQDLGQLLYDTLNSQILADNFGSDNTSEGRKTLPDIARANVNSMIGAVTA